MIPVHIQGLNPDADAAVEDIRTSGGSMTYLGAAAALYISSSSASDTAPVIVVEAVDTDGNPVVLEATITGQTAALLNTNDATPVAQTALRVNKAYNKSGTALVGDVYVFTTDTLSSGVPTTASKIQTKILIGKEESEDALFYVPNGMQLTDMKLQASILQPATATAHVDIFVYVRESGGVFRIKYSGSMYLEGKSQLDYCFPDNVSFKAKSDVVVRVDTDTANGIVSCSLDGQLRFYGQ